MAKLILLRHGASVWNQKNVFTGWVDVPLAQKGMEEALKAGQELAALRFDVVYTSTLVRAMQTTLLCLLQNRNAQTPVIMSEEVDTAKDWAKIYSADMLAEVLPIYKDWRLNERYYGQLQGLNKQSTTERYGETQVKVWRRSYDVAPPGGEALKDTAERTLEFFKAKIIPLLSANKNVLIVAHGNSLRSMVMHLDKLDATGVANLEIPTGVPLLYDCTAHPKGMLFQSHPV